MISLLKNSSLFEKCSIHFFFFTFCEHGTNEKMCNSFSLLFNIVVIKKKKKQQKNMSSIRVKM